MTPLSNTHFSQPAFGSLFFIRTSDFRPISSQLNGAKVAFKTSPTSHCGVGIDVPDQNDIFTRITANYTQSTVLVAEAPHNESNPLAKWSERMNKRSFGITD